MKTEEIAQIILSFVFIALFISIFFFTYIAKVEKEIIENHINESVASFSTDMSIFLTPEKKKLIREIILQNIQVPEQTDNDLEIDKQNKTIFNKTIIIFTIIVIIGLIIVGVLWSFYKFDIIYTIKYNMLMLVLTAVVYFLFITYITRKYILVDKNYISYIIISALYNYSNSP